MTCPATSTSHGVSLCRCVAVSLCHVGILHNLDAAAAKHFFGKWIFDACRVHAEYIQSTASCLGRPCLISRGFLPLLPGLGDELGPLLPPERPGLHRELPPASRHSSRASTSSTGSTSPTSPTKSLTRAPAFNASHLDFLRLISALDFSPHANCPANGHPWHSFERSPTIPPRTSARYSRTTARCLPRHRQSPGPTHQVTKSPSKRPKQRPSTTKQDKPRRRPLGPPPCYSRTRSKHLAIIPPDVAFSSCDKSLSTCPRRLSPFFTSASFPFMTTLPI